MRLRRAQLYHREAQGFQGADKWILEELRVHQRQIGQSHARLVCLHIPQELALVCGVRGVKMCKNSRETK